MCWFDCHETTADNTDSRAWPIDLKVKVRLVVVPGAGLEPAKLTPADFKSRAMKLQEKARERYINEISRLVVLAL